MAQLPFDGSWDMGVVQEQGHRVSGDYQGFDVPRQPTEVDWEQKYRDLVIDYDNFLKSGMYRIEKLEKLLKNRS